MFFYHHDHREQEDENSFYNLHEVFMALHLALYLVREQACVSPHRITILTTYNAQLNQLENERAQGDWSWLEEVRMAVVDSFQGEENDVIILSLVRNNTRNSVGFLRTNNRICVALSRARNGLYILGSMTMLAKANPLWARMERVLIENGEIGEEFPLQCNNHKHVIRLVNSEIFVLLILSQFVGQGTERFHILWRNLRSSPHVWPRLARVPQGKCVSQIQVRCFRHQNIALWSHGQNEVFQQHS